MAARRLRAWVGRRLSGRAARPAPAGRTGRAAPAAGAPRIDYAPSADGDADPGEVVWAWVPYEEDASRGKDRPVLVLGRDAADLLALMLTSKDHDHDPRRGFGDPVWLDVGTGGWDRQGRPSEVRLDRVLRLAPAAVRREGAALDRARFDEVVAAARQLHGW